MKETCSPGSLSVRRTAGLGRFLLGLLSDNSPANGDCGTAYLPSAGPTGSLPTTVGPLLRSSPPRTPSLSPGYYASPSNAAMEIAMATNCRMFPGMYSTLLTQHLPYTYTPLAKGTHSNPDPADARLSQTRRFHLGSG
ncbi:hypothetical protein Bbelb_245830 [Branchiostoma belcheri]|nr:hypothetical protein Bbelb_245830 [Branchiostoma belcheri]